MQHVARRFVPRSFANERTLYDALMRDKLRDIPHTVTRSATPPHVRSHNFKDYVGELRYVPVFEARTFEEYQWLLGERLAANYSPPEPEYECHKMAILSTAHVSLLSLTLVGHGSSLLKVLLPFDPQFENVPVDLQEVFAYMAKEDVAYVVFDKETPPIAGLKVYA
jgi:hypothetical protein